MSRRSGFCNRDWPLDVAWGAESHARCPLIGCICECHTPEPAPTPPTADQCERYVGPSNITAAHGTYSWWETRPVDGSHPRLTLRHDHRFPEGRWVSPDWYLAPSPGIQPGHAVVLSGASYVHVEGLD